MNAIGQTLPGRLSTYLGNPHGIVAFLKADLIAPAGKG